MKPLSDGSAARNNASRDVRRERPVGPHKRKFKRIPTSHPYNADDDEGPPFSWYKPVPCAFSDPFKACR
jgi:hypothetical protein